MHDSRILWRSALFEAFESNRRSINSFLLGDSGYMLREWLLIPVTNHQTRQEQNYNFTHRSTRTAVERSTGVVKRWWHCLHRLRVSPQKAVVVYSLMFFHFFYSYIVFCDYGVFFGMNYCTQCTDKGDDVCLTSPNPCVSHKRPVRPLLRVGCCTTALGYSPCLIQTTTMTLAILVLILITKQMAITNVHNILHTYAFKDTL